MNPTVGRTAAALLAGLLSFGSPCVLPLVPTYLALLGGTSPARATTDLRHRTTPAVVLFAAGFAGVFIALGASATAAGRLLALHRDVLQLGAGLAVVAFGCVALVVAGDRLTPASRDLRWHPRLSRWGRAGPVVLGAAFALGWSPCIGPVLGSVLAMAATGASVAEGSWLLACYSLGIAVPLVACSVVVERTPTVIGWLARHVRPVTRYSGLLLVAVGGLVASGELAGLESWL
jgi:cytochrome c-type biogenesis protein